MKALSVLLLSGALLAPSPARAEQTSLPSSRVDACTEPDGRAARLWRLATDGARVSFGAAELQLQIAKRQLAITLSLAL